MGVHGWSLSIALDGDIDFGPHGVATSGTSVDLYFSSGFILASVVDPGKNGGQRGAISAVVLSIPEARTLPAAGTESVLDLELVPGGPVQDASRLSWSHQLGRSNYFHPGNRIEIAILGPYGELGLQCQGEQVRILGVADIDQPVGLGQE